jgi:hypothetical protein
MNVSRIASLAVAALVAACGPAKFEGPLTQIKLDEVQAECGMTSAKLVSVDADGKAKISSGTVNMEAGDAAGVDLLYKSKCLEERLTALGVEYDVSIKMESPQFEAKVNRAIEEM